MFTTYTLGMEELFVLSENISTFGFYFLNNNIRMNNEKDLIEFDDSDAIKFIYNILSEEQKQRIDDNTIQYVLDLICEYYDQNGLIDEDTVEEAEIAEDDILNFVSGLARREQVVALTDEDIQTILEGEYRYGIAIGIYSETEE